ncbi:MAG: flagellar regulator YcgR PilZN domain-containing protein [Burkholderiaceae bacterium]
MQPLGISSMHLPEPEDSALRPFAIHQPEAIRRTLQAMFEHAELITVFAQDNPHCFLLTQILAIGEAGMVIDLKTDEGRIAELTRRGHCTAISLAQGVKFQFSMAIEKIDRQGDTISARCRLPAVVYRIQRRDAFRVRPPAGYGAAVVLRDPDGAEQRIELDDISATGISFTVQSDPARWHIGRQFEHSRLYLGMYPPIPCTVAISGIITPGVSPALETAPGYHVGCELRHMSGEAERNLQRFITDVQRASRKLPPL